MQDEPSRTHQYRLFADEVRTIAEGIFDREERQKIMQIAREYEQLAVEAEARGWGISLPSQAAAGGR